MNIWGVVSSASVIFPVLSGIYAFTRTKKYGALLFFFCFTLLIETIANALVFDNFSNNIWVYNIFSLVEGVFWILLLAHWMPRYHTLLIRSLSLFFALVWVYTTLILQTLKEYNSYSSITECLILIPLSCIFLVGLSRKASVPILDLPEFWFITGVLFFFSSTSVIQATALYKIDGVILMRTTYYLHVFFNIISNLIFAKAFLCSHRKIT